MAYSVGDVLPFATTVKDSAGVLANAGTMTLTVTVTGNDGATAQITGSPFTVTPTSTGLYDRDVTSTQAGLYVGSWVSTGVNAGTWSPDLFDVRPLDAKWLVSLARAKKHLNETSTTHDDELEGWIEAATHIVESHPVYGIGPVLSRVVVEDHDGGCGVVYLNQTPVISLTSVVPVRTGGAAVNVADLDVNTTTGKLQYLTGVAFPSGPYRFTYRAGYVVPPANVTGGALIIIKGLWETQRGPGLQSTLQAGGDVAELPGMGLYMWRAKLLLDATPRVPGVA